MPREGYVRLVTQPNPAPDARGTVAVTCSERRSEGSTIRPSITVMVRITSRSGSRIILRSAISSLVTVASRGVPRIQCAAESPWE